MKKASVITAILVLAIVTVPLVGCSSVDITKTSSGYYNPTNPNTIEILKTRPNRSYEELGTFTVTGFASTDTAKMHNAIRAKAATLGADAAIITEQGMLPAFGGYQQWATGVAIRYKGAK